MSALKFDRLRPEEYTKGWVVAEKNRHLPAVVRPDPAAGYDSSLESLKKLVKENKDAIRTRLYEDGAVLFRGFNVKGPQDFEDVALLVNPNLSKEYLGTSPRKAVTEYTFTASELPFFFPIPQHIEMSFLPSQPKMLMFSCLYPAETGGETPLCDFNQVYLDLDPEVRRKFEERGVLYYRNYSSPSERIKLDPWKLKKWPEIFCTTNKAEVEATCAREKVQPEWKPDGGLRLTNKKSAIAIRHNPQGVEQKIWSNHSQVFHPSQAADEYRRIAKLTGVWWHYLMALILCFVMFIKRFLQKEEEQGMNTFYGDKSTLTNSDMDKVRDAIWKNMVIYPWKQGDIVVIDNTLVSHGRLPYSGKRTVHVAWGN